MTDCRRESRQVGGRTHSRGDGKKQNVINAG